MPKPKMPVHLVVGKGSDFLKEAFLKWQSEKWESHLLWLKGPYVPSRASY